MTTSFLPYCLLIVGLAVFPFTVSSLPIEDGSGWIPVKDDYRASELASSGEEQPGTLK
ncbi:unnamed protein product [Strongylus vulgaris]|uniref:Uncharacterized protein n=1 Tax=Strongylus vulgaris TaxID=40348 RepID=A0A3P7JJI8_STRVU|nr:unnamed protein product [Strongylus vulgaris]